MDFKLVYYNNPILNQELEGVKEITPEIQEICNAMIKANRLYDGIAIAANQLGISKKIIALTPIEPFQKDICLINPKILSYSDKKVIFEEGCLSFPKLYLKISRPEEIKVEYQLLSGKTYQLAASGILARVLQHEIDHTNGISFYKRIPEKLYKKIEKTLETIDKKYNKK